ncbi:hypothetical protein OF83DRAFT_1146572 [Amylostereum chailletii]|nr:hypothetical protein OF83DRAFT_1146572 [Amylostereum chailletii]
MSVLCLPASPRSVPSSRACTYLLPSPSFVHPPRSPLYPSRTFSQRREDPPAHLRPPPARTPFLSSECIFSCVSLSNSPFLLCRRILSPPSPSPCPFYPRTPSPPIPPHGRHTLLLTAQL